MRRNVLLDLVSLVGVGITASVVMCLLPGVARHQGLDPLGIALLAAAPFAANVLGLFANRLGPGTSRGMSLFRAGGALLLAGHGGAADPARAGGARHRLLDLTRVLQPTPAADVGRHVPGFRAGTTHRRRQHRQGSRGGHGHPHRRHPRRPDRWHGRGRVRGRHRCPVRHGREPHPGAPRPRRATDLGARVVGRVPTPTRPSAGRGRPGVLRRGPHRCRSAVRAGTGRSPVTVDGRDRPHRHPGRGGRHALLPRLGFHGRPATDRCR